MNLCKLPDPISFTGNIAQNWTDFEEQLQWFLAGTESSSKSDETKIGIMLTHAGKEAREVYNTLLWNEEGDKKKFNKVLEAFQHYCAPRKNILFERHCFWNSGLQQMESESINAYLTRLKVKIDVCEYSKEGWPAAMRLEMLHDRFVFGLLDDTVKEKLTRKRPRPSKGGRDRPATRIVEAADKRNGIKTNPKCTCYRL